RWNHQQQRREIETVSTDQGRKAGDQQQVERPLKEPLCGAVARLLGRKIVVACGHTTILAEFGRHATRFLADKRNESVKISLAGSRATKSRQPRQVRKEATVTG